MVTYNPAKDKVYALLKDQAKSDDIIKAAFHVSTCPHCIKGFLAPFIVYPLF